MDSQTLRDELLAGARLPSPTYGNPKLSHLIQTCWLADPIERPTFTKIKENLKQACQITTKNLYTESKSTDYLSLLSDISSQMRKQYKMIQESNPLYELEKPDLHVIADEDGIHTPYSDSGGSYSYFEENTPVKSVIADVITSPSHGAAENLIKQDTVKPNTKLGDGYETLPFLEKYRCNAIDYHDDVIEKCRSNENLDICHT